MALVLADRVLQTGTANTTVSFNLTTAVSGYQSFAVIGNGNTTYYGAWDGTNWEVGIGTYSTSGPILTRTTIIVSSNSNAAVSTFGSVISIFVTQPAEKAVYLDASGNASALGTISSGTWNATTIGTAYGGTGLTSFTANGIVYASSTSALATGSGLLFDGSNLGLGITPSPWWSGRRGFQTGSSSIGEAHLVCSPGTANYLELGSNYYINSSQQPIAISTSTTTSYVQGSGIHIMNSGSGTAGSPISQSIVFQASASSVYLGTGTASSTSPATVEITTATTYNSNIQRTLALGGTDNGFVNNSVPSSWRLNVTAQSSGSPASGMALYIDAYLRGTGWTNFAFFGNNGILTLNPSTTTSLYLLNSALGGGSSSGTTGLYLGDAASGVNMLTREKVTTNTASANIYTEYGYGVAYKAYSAFYNSQTWYVNGSAALWLNSSAQFFVGSTSYSDAQFNSYGGGHAGNFVTGSATSGAYSCLILRRSAPSTGDVIENYYGSTYCGGMYIGTSTTGIASSSDSRLKKDKGVSTDTSVIDNTVIHDFEWIRDGIIDKGVFAQEAINVKPNAVIKGKDDLMADGTPVRPWTVNYIAYIPELIVYAQQLKKQLNEQSALIAQLKARIDAANIA